MITPDDNISSRLYHFNPDDNITVAPDDNIASQMITFNPR
jgi:hypothetical protein